MEEAICPEQCCSAWYLHTAHLYEEHNFIDVTAVIPARYEPVPQSSTEQCGMYFAKSSAAALVLGHCTPVWQQILKGNWSETKLYGQLLSV